MGMEIFPGLMMVRTLAQRAHEQSQNFESATTFLCLTSRRTILCSTPLERPSGHPGPLCANPLPTLVQNKEREIADLEAREEEFKLKEDEVKRLVENVHGRREGGRQGQTHQKDQSRLGGIGTAIPEPTRAG